MILQNQQQLFMNKGNFKEKDGLTMIELLATIAILVAAVTTVLVLGDRAVSQAGLFTTYTRAAFLAQEGMEIVSDPEVREGLDITSVKKEHLVSYKDLGSGFVFEGDCSEKISIDNNGFYGYEGSEGTIFSRCVTLWREDENIKAEIEVSFEYRNNSHDIKLYRVFYE